MLLEAVLILTILIISIYIMLIDIQKKLIYDEAILALSVPAIVSFFVFPEVSLGSRLLGAVSVSGIMLLLNVLRPGAFGGGDIKLMVPLGFWLGLSMAVLTGILAVFIGSVWGLVRVFGQRKGSEIRKNGRTAKTEEGVKADKAVKVDRVMKAGGVLKAGRKMREHGTVFPFAPALCIGAWISFCLGDVLWQWLW